MAEFSFVPPTRIVSTPPKKHHRRLWLFIATSVLAVMIAVAVGVVWWYSATVNSPDQASGSLVQFTIKEGEQAHQIAVNLEQAGLISHIQVFEFYTRWSGASANLQSGQFQIPQHISIHDLVARLQKAKRDEATLRFVEGWRREEMADYMDQQQAAGAITMTGAEFSALALEPSAALRAKLGSELAAGDSLQGFLFPDTYVVNRDETAEGLLSKMLDTYKKRLPATFKADVAKHDLDVYQGLILASIVERESRIGSERAVIAGILYNRLQLGMPLGVDATLQYALGYSESEQRWWRQNLTTDDLAVSSPYNTRLNAGLPPHPICNPSLTAIQAVAQPEQTDYLYYIHDADGQAHYAKTLAEHNANISRYLR